MGKEHHNHHQNQHTKDKKDHDNRGGDHSDPSKHKEGEHKNHKKNGPDHSAHHGHMIEDFKRRFWVSIIITIPIIVISPMIHHFLGLEDSLRFSGDMYVLFALSSVVYFYGGWPFLKGIYDVIKKRQPGMMTLIALAISVAYFYSSATVFGVKGEDFFWELATLLILCCSVTGLK
jgi:Cu2+-exporting ATPase